MQSSETNFISGLDLSEAFYHEAVEQIIRQELPSLSYAAALVGSGSEVLGLDTEMSTDHHWGPRVISGPRRGLDGLFESGRQGLPNWDCAAEAHFKRGENRVSAANAAARQLLARNAPITTQPL